MTRMTITSKTEKLTINDSHVGFFSILNLLESVGYVNEFYQYNEKILGILINHDERKYCYFYEDFPELMEGFSIKLLMGLR